MDDPFFETYRFARRRRTSAQTPKPTATIDAGSLPLVELPFLIWGFKEVHLTYFVGGLFGYAPSSRELMAWHDGLIPFGITLELPLPFCLANFVLVLGFFLIVFSFKKLIVLRGKSKTDLIGDVINK